jgi:hypothetical protein
VLHPILGELDPSAPGCWEASITLGGRAVEFDLTINGSGLTEADLEDLPQKAEDVVALDRAARRAMLRDARSGDEDSSAMLYLTHHEEVLPETDRQRLFGTTTPGSANVEAMLSRMVLVRVGLFPEYEDPRVVLDYSIDPTVTDYLLCVSFDAAGKPTAVDMES